MGACFLKTGAPVPIRYFFSIKYLMIASYTHFFFVFLLKVAH